MSSRARLRVLSCSGTPVAQTGRLDWVSEEEFLALRD